MADILKGPEPKPKTVVGPKVSGNSVIIDNREIPKMRCYEQGDQIEFILAGRYSYSFPKEWAYLATTFAAQAMAIGAGYPSMSAETKDQPFAPKVFEITLDKEI